MPAHSPSAKKTPFKIAVLGIGTELTSGQILNRNGQWISKKMKDLGMQTACHLVVPDDRSLILQSLNFCFAQAEVIFVTGGLGPTSDDFTRDVIAEWTERQLFFHQDSWDHINERLSSRGIIVREIQRQQCFYPTDSTVLPNRMGTANAFCLTHLGKEVFVLPGPPNEIESVWNEFIAPQMSLLSSEFDRLITKSWDCIGVGESEISHLAEAALEGRPSELHLDIGYRVHVPYVEFKISYFESQKNEAAPWLLAIEKALAPHCVLKDGGDVADLLAQKLAQFKSVTFTDSLSGAHLLSRLFPFIKPLLSKHQIQFCTHPLAPTETAPQTAARRALPVAELLLKLESAGASSARVSLVYKGQTITDVLETTYSSVLMKERERQCFAELALIFWLQQLSSLN